MAPISSSQRHGVWDYNRRPRGIEFSLTKESQARGEGLAGKSFLPASVAAGKSSLRPIRDFWHDTRLANTRFSLSAEEWRGALSMSERALSTTTAVTCFRHIVRAPTLTLRHPVVYYLLIILLVFALAVSRSSFPLPANRLARQRRSPADSGKTGSRLSPPAAIYPGILRRLKPDHWQTCSQQPSESSATHDAYLIWRQPVCRFPRDHFLAGRH